MSIGAIYCPKEESKRINDRIRNIKIRNYLPATRELKWTKVSPSCVQVYLDLINYFFDDDDLHFRVIVIKEKERLDHDRYGQTHDEWYYKMYFNMLKNILNPADVYNIYIDIKDTNSYTKAKQLQNVCCNSIYDFSHKTIKKLQPIRSDEVQIMQITDILIGAITHYNREFPPYGRRSASKQQVIDLIRTRSGYSLTKSTLSREDKTNLFFWEADWNVSR